MAYQGKFAPRNPAKYIGDVSNIVYRSSWELRVMSWLDTNDVVECWGSEELVIPYRSPIDKSIHRYYPDFLVKLRQPDGTHKITIIEVKPLHETVLPVMKKGKSKRRLMNEIITYQTNQSKWSAARAFVADKGWSFQVMTEEDIFGRRPK